MYCTSTFTFHERRFSSLSSFCISCCSFPGCSWHIALGVILQMGDVVTCYVWRADIGHTSLTHSAKGPSGFESPLSIWLGWPMILADCRLQLCSDGGMVLGMWVMQEAGKLESLPALVLECFGYYMMLNELEIASPRGFVSTRPPQISFGFRVIC